MYSALDNNLSVPFIFVDFAKGFDAVNHDILLDELFHDDIRGPIHSWLRDYLTNRVQETMHESRLSTPNTISTGVPQDSVLGSIPFVIYINDISNISLLNPKAIFFLNDMTMYQIGLLSEQLIASINTGLHELYKWCICNRLTIDIDKTYFTLFTHRKTLHLPPVIVFPTSLNSLLTFSSSPHPLIYSPFYSPSRPPSYPSPH